ncbi:MAG TPA: thioredoxin domain-containing protein [Chryseolinea sp.]|nr:thioredoxin domain-containing protein [Chryseolinea sp.]
MKTLRPAINEKDQQNGNLDSGLILVEYGDYQCPYCRRAHPVVQRMLNEHGSELKFVFRHFPLQEVHAQAFSAALAAEAAGRQGKFWSMHNLLFENQDQFHQKTVFLDLAKELGLDLGQFIVDRKREDLICKIEKDFKSGLYSGVNRTPTFFVNETKISTYDGSYESLLATVELFV